MGFNSAHKVSRTALKNYQSLLEQKFEQRLQ